MSRRPPSHSSFAGRVPTETFKPSVPDVPSVTVAMAHAEPLVSLMQRLEASKRCLAAVKAVLPVALAAHVKPGGWDEEGWTLLAPNAAASAKLRQLQPRMMDALLRSGIKVSAIRVRVQSQ